MSEIPRSAARAWSAVLIVAAVALAIGGGAADNFRPAAPVDRVSEAPLPIPLSPAGEVPAPPSLFQWTAGSADRDLAHVTLFRKTLEPFWNSAPTESTSILVIPGEVFEGVPSGEPIYWRVREVRGGRPLASSALMEFQFVLDLEGRPESESVADEPILLSD